MSKAILVIDIPSDCYHCQLHDYEYRWCYGKDESSVLTEEDIESKRVEGCPLKPMPQPIWHEEGKENECEEWYRNGWNACLDAIIGGTNDGTKNVGKDAERGKFQ